MKARIDGCYKVCEKANRFWKSEPAWKIVAARQYCRNSYNVRRSSRKVRTLEAGNS